MKEFTQADITDHGAGYQKIYADRADLIDAPTEWQKRGLQETASGYGRRLNTGLKIRYCGHDYRLYATCYSNASSVWFTIRGHRIYVG